MTMRHDLLTEPILSWRDRSRKRSFTTLPGLLARLAAGELSDFSRVRAHQFHPWAMFLTQLAGIALHRADRTDPRVSEEEWREMLLRLTGEQHEPWCLLVEDLVKPAFFQPPVQDGWEPGKNEYERPDQLDILVTAKAHDVKNELISGADVESWVYALVTLQTMQGYPGRGYNGVARMKGGYGNRPRVGLAGDHTIGARFSRDVAVLLKEWQGLVDERGFAEDGAALVWTVPWDGQTPLRPEDLCPHFIEVCWRVRMLEPAGGLLRCAYTTTTAKRCLFSASKDDDKGDVGDVWIPVERGGGALTIGKGGFHYSKLVHVLAGDDYEPAPAQKLCSGDDDPILFLASAMARGQGKTEGLHERVLSIAGEVRRRLGAPDQRAALGKRGLANVKRAEDMRSKVLSPSLRALAAGRDPMENSFDARVDEVFFADLFSTVGEDDESAQHNWDCRLAALAKDELARAIERSCLGDARRYRAIAEAASRFHFNLKKHFPDVTDAAKADTAEANEERAP